MVECLITSGADNNAVNKVSFVLFVSSYHDIFNITIYLQATPLYYAFLIQDHLTPLHYAVCKGHDSVVEYLVSSGADINAATVVGFVCIVSSYHDVLLHYLAKSNSITLRCSVWSCISCRVFDKM